MWLHLLRHWESVIAAGNAVVCKPRLRMSRTLGAVLLVVTLCPEGIAEVEL